MVPDHDTLGDVERPPEREAEIGAGGTHRPGEHGGETDGVAHTSASDHEGEPGLRQRLDVERAIAFAPELVGEHVRLGRRVDGDRLHVQPIALDAEHLLHQEGL